MTSLLFYCSFVVNDPLHCNVSMLFIQRSSEEFSTQSALNICLFFRQQGVWKFRDASFSHDVISILSPPVTQSDESSLLLAVTGCSFSSNLTVQTSLWDSLLWSSHFYGHQSVFNYVWKSISATLSCKMCFVNKVWCDLTSWRYTQHLLWGMCWCLSGVNVQMIFKGDEKGVITNHETENITY